MHLDDIKKKAVTTLFELFEFLSKLFGLKNDGKTFQSFISEVINRFPDVFVYVVAITKLAATIKFKHLIEGRHTVVFTDHKPVTSSFERSRNNTNNSRQSRQFSLLTEHLAEIHQISGSTNVVADCFS